MATDSELGFVEFFEDFLGDVIADKPEYGVDTDPAVDIITATDGSGIGGVVRVTMDAGQANIGGIGFGTTVWSAHDNFLEYQIRVKFSALGAASERVFVGFTDVQADTIGEMPFTGATTLLTASGDPDDAIGFFWEGDMTGQRWIPGSVKADAVVIQPVADMSAVELAKCNITAATWQTLKFRIQNDAKYVEFFVDGNLVYVYDGSTACITDVALMPTFVVTEGTTAINFDVDYVRVRMGRDN